MSRKISDGTEHGANVLFDELVHCYRRGTVFYAGGRSKDYQRCGAMTEEYTRELHAKLGALLAELDAERGGRALVFDDVDLTFHEERLDFVLKLNGKEAARGAVTKKAAQKAKRILDGFFAPDNVLKFRRKGVDAIALAICFLPLFEVG